MQKCFVHVYSVHFNKLNYNFIFFVFKFSIICYFTCLNNINHFKKNLLFCKYFVYDLYNKNTLLFTKVCSFYRFYDFFFFLCDLSYMYITTKTLISLVFFVNVVMATLQTVLIQLQPLQQKYSNIITKYSPCLCRYFLFELNTIFYRVW